MRFWSGGSYTGILQMPLHKNCWTHTHSIHIFQGGLRMDMSSPDKIIAIVRKFSPKMRDECAHLFNGISCVEHTSKLFQGPYAQPFQASTHAASAHLEH